MGHGALGILELAVLPESLSVGGEVCVQPLCLN